jgi:hypothetical protein
MHCDLQTIIFLKDEILGGWVGQDNFVQKAKFKKIDNYEWPLNGQVLFRRRPAMC